MVALEDRPELIRKLKILQREKDRERNDTTVLWGYTLLALTFVFFVGTVYALVVSKMMPHTGNAVSMHTITYQIKRKYNYFDFKNILDWIKDDYFYCMLVPVTIPVTVIAVYLNWLSLKFFRHN